MLIPQDYAMVLDVWEGALDIDEALIRSEGVEGIMIRINDTVGGNHYDANFRKQWDESKAFKRGVYFVVAPWDSRSAQVNWLLANLPYDCHVIGLDVELVYAGISKTAYAALVKGIRDDLRGKGYEVKIYTGPWFLANLDLWPSDSEYWWARYPFFLYPSERIAVTWAWLKDRLSQLTWAPGTAPGKVVIWQCSADRYILPGCANRAMDINVMLRAEFTKTFHETNLVYLPIVIGTGPAPLYMAACTAVPNLRIRSAASFLGLVIGSLATGQLVNVYAEKNGFAKINKDKQEWASLSYLRRV